MCEKTVGSVLFDRYVKFFHAANLRDFRTYCQRREVLARSELTATTDGFTPFFSDPSDQERGVWNRVFGNIQDFNGLFWANDSCVPNAYGPITMVFGRVVWKASTDIAVSRENAANEGYSLETCRMLADDLENCFEKNGKYWRLKCYGLEVSFGVQTLAFEDIEKVIVDPVDDAFLERVRDLWVTAGGDGGDVVPRGIGGKQPSTEKLRIYRELITWASSLAGNVPNSTVLRTAVPPELAEWTSKLPGKLWGPLRQWLEYTYNGTLR